MFKRYSFSVFYQSIKPHTNHHQINIINILLLGDANPTPKIISETTSRYASGEVDVPNHYCTDMNPVIETADFRKNLSMRIAALNLERTDIIVARIKHLISEYDLEMSEADKQKLFGTYKNDTEFLVDAFKFSLRYKRGVKYKLIEEDIQLIRNAPKQTVDISGSLEISPRPEGALSLKILKIEISTFRKTVEDILNEPYNPDNSTSRELSPDGIKTYNRIAEKFNSVSSEYSMSIFVEDTTPNLVTHPKANEILGQLDCALAVINEIQLDKQQKTSSSEINQCNNEISDQNVLSIPYHESFSRRQVDLLSDIFQDCVVRYKKLPYELFRPDEKHQVSIYTRLQVFLEIGHTIFDIGDIRGGATLLPCEENHCVYVVEIHGDLNQIAECVEELLFLRTARRIRVTFSSPERQAELDIEELVQVIRLCSHAPDIRFGIIHTRISDISKIRMRMIALCENEK